MSDNIFEEFGLDANDPNSVDELIDISNPKVYWDNSDLQSKLSEIEKEFGIFFGVKKETKRLDENDFVNDEITITVSNCYLNDRFLCDGEGIVYKGSKRYKEIQDEIDTGVVFDDEYKY